MLSKVLATLVASMAVAFAGYTLVSDSMHSHCCSGSSTMVLPVSSESSCCEAAAPSCCQEAPAAVLEATCPACSADKVAVPAKDKAPTTDGEK